MSVFDSNDAGPYNEDGGIHMISDKSASILSASVSWENDRLFLLDQTLLPNKKKYITVDSIEIAAEAIRSLRVRGAPAIGVAAAYSLYIHSSGAHTADEVRNRLIDGCAILAATRPTAVNLSWALERVKNAGLKALDGSPDDPAIVKAAVLGEAQAIHREDVEMCRSIGQFGADLLKDGMTVLTYCNAGRLATSGIGTALAPVYTAADRGMKISVYACETRPLLQGARLTAWELAEGGIDVTLICDNMAASVMASGKIDAVIVGCDRVATNGDAANKIGTYGLAQLARAHAIPFYVAAPTSTIDAAGTATGRDIKIEERGPDEIAFFNGRRIAPEGVRIFNPAFDITPAKLISAFITDRGVIFPPYDFTVGEPT